jgi:hypothetical protein
MANRNFMEENLRRLEQELLDHKRNLTMPGITNEERMRLLIAVRDVEREMEEQLNQQHSQVEDRLPNPEKD